MLAIQMFRKRRIQLALCNVSPSCRLLPATKLIDNRGIGTVTLKRNTLLFSRIRGVLVKPAMPVTALCDGTGVAIGALAQTRLNLWYAAY